MKSINIVTVATPNLLDKVYIQMNSIKRNKHYKTMVGYYLFIDCDSKWPLDKCKEYFADLQSEDFYIHFEDANVYRNRVAHTTVHWTTWLRCLLPKLFLFDRIVLYLDADVMCLRPGIEELFDVPVDDYFVAGVLDPPVLFSSFGRHDDKNTGNTNYFNAGVMLLNLKMIREHGKDKDLSDWCRMWDFNKVGYNWHDQTLCNYMLKDKVLVLPYKWNNQFLGSFNICKDAYTHYLNDQGFLDPVDSLDSTVLLHFCGWNKPWKQDVVAQGSADYPWLEDAVRIWKDLEAKYGKR